MEELRNLNHEIETANKNSLKQENESWQTIVDELQVIKFIKNNVGY